MKKQYTITIVGIALLVVIAVTSIVTIHKLNNQPSSQQLTTDSNSYYQLASVSYNAKDYETAISKIDQAIAIDRTNPVYWQLKIDSYYLAGNSSAALQTVNEALTVLPDNDMLLSKKDVLSKDYFPVVEDMNRQ